MSLTLGIRRPRKHRAVDAVANLRNENHRLLTQLIGARDHIGVQEQQLAEVRAKRAEAEQVVTCLDADLRERTEELEQALARIRQLQTQLAPILAAEATANAVTVPAAIRDIGRFEDQATEPIRVRPLWEAIGPVVRTEGSADPAHLPTT
ncbi:MULTISPECIES: hypothetical protein [Streptomyces]|uniref:hypothetical protein n=1 Tax=Streptomyces TaxID=1883 RepID=UPI000DFE437E|nr:MULTISPECIES: hypothetical protein [Streptomyces]MBT3077571.1 hypothetical protein [Streptomyces sp. COG21]MBT3084416.1 hypothetical protein [Streptomyces sp. COG20]MBT3086988.1 hypothetical protein [Streptomyces sp. CYG21]MBT3098742.1 hypothetical protein [Streptomyces sp. CBG30]MBT3103634.1 hypothetical protein [Streptomyces sp. COG19]